MPYPTPAHFLEDRALSTYRALVLVVAALGASALLSGCTTATPPKPSPSSGPLANVTQEVLDLRDAFQTAHDQLTGGITTLEELIADQATDCRIEAEIRIADQIVELSRDHQGPLQALIASEVNGGQHDEAALAKATADLDDLQTEIDGNADALASCEKEVNPGSAASTDAPDVRARRALATDFTSEVTILSNNLQTLISDVNNEMINIQYIPQSWPNAWNTCFQLLQVSVDKQAQNIVSLRPQLQTLVANESGSSDTEAVGVKELNTAIEAAQTTLDGNQTQFLACDGNVSSGGNYLLNGGDPFGN